MIEKKYFYWNTGCCNVTQSYTLNRNQTTVSDNFWSCRDFIRPNSVKVIFDVDKSRLMALILVTLTFGSLFANLYHMAYFWYPRKEIKSDYDGPSWLEYYLYQEREQERLPFLFYNCGSFIFRYSTKLYLDIAICLIIPGVLSAFFYCSMILHLIRRERDQTQVHFLFIS